MKPKRVSIRGERWTIHPTPPPDEKARGLCVFKTGRIYFTPNADAASTLIHEVLHAALPDLDEDAVLGTEQAIARALRKFGFIE
jgi:hypothetical protein